MGIFLQDLINVAIATHFRIMCSQKNAILFLVFEVDCVNQGVVVQYIWGCSKGQLISKWFLGVVDFFQKTNKSKSTCGIIVVKLNLFVHFLEEINDPKKPFRN